MDLQERIAQLSPKQRALLERRLERERPAPRPRPLRTWNGAGAPLSFAQERLWFLAKMEPESGVYNLPIMVPLACPVEPAIAEAAVRALVARHSSLRTRFVVEGDTPRQVIGGEAVGAYDFATVNLRELHGASETDIVARLSREHVWVPFDLERGPLLRVRLIEAAGEAALLVVMHHIVSDGWSLSVFVREFQALYEAALRGEPATLPDANQYVDFAAGQREQLQGETLERHVAYWRAQLEGAPPLIDLPLDHHRPARQSFAGALHELTLDRTREPLTALCRDTGTVPFMVLFAAFNVLLFRYTHLQRIVVGTPIANRTRSELEGVIGFFTNTLAICTEVREGMSFRELLEQVRETTLSAYEHQDLPFERLVSELQPERSLAYNPVFQVMFSFQNMPGGEGADASSTPLADVPSKFDLSLALVGIADGFSATFEYATDLFDGDTITRMAGHLHTVVEHVLAHPDDDVTAFSLLSAAEQHTLLHEFNDTACEWPAFEPLYGGFERWARATPSATAVRFRDRELSYGELDARAEAVAARLRDGGAGAGAIVGICVRRSLELVVGLLGILKAGAAYMPIDPEFPAERIAYMLTDARAEQVLATADSADAVADLPVDVIRVDRFDASSPPTGAAAHAAQPGDLAYVLYTSGSTGEPKGVMVSHGAIQNRLRWMQARYALGRDERVLQKTPLTFDVSVWELFWPLAEGACLIVAEPERHKEPRYLVELIRSRQVTCLHFVPSMLDAFLAEDVESCSSLKRIVCSGEAMTIEQCRRLQALRGVSGHNLYGPTEAAVDVTHWDCDDWHNQYLSVPIGKPIANTQTYILDGHRQPVPIGVTGELYLGGANLAEGYLNKPELTGAAFIPNPLPGTPGRRLYRTGDLARYRADGTIEYIGRRDAQVKLRGVRIELGEVEAVLRRHPAISEAAVVVRAFDEHDSRLVAYVVADAPVDSAEVRAFAARTVPSYMVPAIIMPLPELPLSRSGKLDRRLLPEPVVVASAAGLSAPVNEVEEVLLEIWQRLLKSERISTTDDFFALGGHSLLAFQAMNAVNRRYEIAAPVRLLFEHPTVAGLASALGEADDELWQDEARTAASLLAHSTRGLAATVDELDEAQLDAILERYRDVAPAALGDDPQALLRWARERPTQSDVPPPAAVPVPTSPSARVAPPPLSPYSRYLPQLAWAVTALAHPEVEHKDDVRAQADAIFARFATEMRARLITNGSGPPPPTALAAWCREVMEVAQVAEQVVRVPDSVEPGR